MLGFVGATGGVTGACCTCGCGACTGGAGGTFTSGGVGC